MFPPGQVVEQVVDRQPAFVSPEVGQLEGELLEQFASGDARGLRVAMYGRQQILVHHAPPGRTTQPVNFGQVAREPAKDEVWQPAGKLHPDLPAFGAVERRGTGDESARLLCRDGGWMICRT